MKERKPDNLFSKNGRECWMLKLVHLESKREIDLSSGEGVKKGGRGSLALAQTYALKMERKWVSKGFMDSTLGRLRKSTDLLLKKEKLE